MTSFQSWDTLRLLVKLNYRPEIDGLRAVAVSAVILYHSQITIFGYKPLKGGFIGVDTRTFIEEE